MISPGKNTISTFCWNWVKPKEHRCCSNQSRGELSADQFAWAGVKSPRHLSPSSRFDAMHLTFLSFANLSRDQRCKQFLCCHPRTWSEGQFRNVASFTIPGVCPVTEWFHTSALALVRGWLGGVLFLPSSPWGSSLQTIFSPLPTSAAVSGANNSSAVTPGLDPRVHSVMLHHSQFQAFARSRNGSTHRRWRLSGDDWVGFCSCHLHLGVHRCRQFSLHRHPLPRSAVQTIPLLSPSDLIRGSIPKCCVIHNSRRLPDHGMVPRIGAAACPGMTGWGSVFTFVILGLALQTPDQTIASSMPQETP